MKDGAETLHEYIDHDTNVGIWYSNLAAELLHALPPSAERTSAMRKLVESYDCARRCRPA